MQASTIVFALVAIAVCVGVALSLMFAVNANSRSRLLQMSWQTSRPAKLAAEVADLHAVLESIKAAHRSEMGRVWQKFASLTEPEPEEVDESRLMYGDGNPQQRSLPLASVPVCENWTAAQLKGPMSKEAKCECGDCTARRASRAAEKARILAERSIAQGKRSE